MLFGVTSFSYLGSLGSPFWSWFCLGPFGQGSIASLVSLLECSFGDPWISSHVTPIFSQGFREDGILQYAILSFLSCPELGVPGSCMESTLWGGSCSGLRSEEMVALFGPGPRLKCFRDPSSAVLHTFSCFLLLDIFGASLGVVAILTRCTGLSEWALPGRSGIRARGNSCQATGLRLVRAP